jgi:hypothetical protein
MLFFRSEEAVREWCRARKATPGPIVTIPQLWGLAKTWYESRLSPEAKRPGPAEMRSIFAALGLVGPFWDPAPA